MARGWESKSAEEQVTANEVDATRAAETKLQGASQAVRSRQRQELELQREHILDARTSNPHRRAALEAALADIEARIGSL